MSANPLTRALLLAGMAAMLVAGCERHGVTIQLTDAPVDSLDQVVVTFDGVTFHNQDGTDVVVDVAPPKSIDLTDYTGGAAAILLDAYPLAAGDYSWFRLSIVPDQTYVVETLGGGQMPLECPSCPESGLKFNRPFTLEETGLVEFTLDFNLRPSITWNANGYKLRPTVRVLGASTVLSGISGAVVDNTAGQDFIGALDAGECVVYAFEGSADAVEPDDIFIDDQGVDRGPPVVNYGEVGPDGNGGYAYLIPDLPAGLDYTVALTCDPDEPDAEDDVTFYGEATVPLGATPAMRDFVLTDPAP
jgi:hypothetical protein